jgi:hypothetical protein
LRHLHRCHPGIEIGFEVKRVPVYFPLFLAVILPAGWVHAQNPGPNQAVVLNTNSSLRNYPGGRDESDLAVQSRKRITKKESEMDESFEGEGPESDTSGDAEGFGE